VRTHLGCRSTQLKDASHKRDSVTRGTYRSYVDKGPERLELFGPVAAALRLPLCTTSSLWICDFGDCDSNRKC